MIIMQEALKIQNGDLNQKQEELPKEKEEKQE